MKKLAIITTHPIQYNAPFFKLLNKSSVVKPKVFYTWGDSVLQKKYDPGFDKTIEWDIPLLEGYDYEFLQNTAKEKGSHHFNGIINPGIVKKINDFNPDALLVYGWKFKSHLQAMRHFKNKIPVWFRGDSVLLNEKKGLKSYFKNLLLVWVYRHIDVAFYSGTNNKHYFKKNGLKSNQLVQALHAVDNNRFENELERYSAPAAAWREKLNIGSTDFVFLFAGKLIATKDINNLVNAFSTLSKKHVHLLIVGNGPEEIYLKNNYAELLNLHFLDFQNQQVMPEIYQVCDVFVLPSIGETWGLSVNEAMAAGKAVLVSDKCGCAIDLVINGENGFIFKAGNWEDLAKKMSLMAEEVNYVKEMQDHSSNRIKNFTFKRFVVAIENLFDKAIE